MFLRLVLKYPDVLLIGVGFCGEVYLTRTPTLYEAPEGRWRKGLSDKSLPISQKKSRLRLKGDVMAIMVYLAQSRATRTPDERRLWFRKHARLALGKGAKFLRESHHPDDVHMTLVEGWDGEPDAMPALRFNRRLVLPQFSPLRRFLRWWNRK